MTPRFCDQCAHCRPKCAGMFPNTCVHPLVAIVGGADALAGDLSIRCRDERARWVPWAPCGRKGKLWTPKGEETKR